MGFKIIAHLREKRKTTELEKAWNMMTGVYLLLKFLGPKNIMFPVAQGNVLMTCQFQRSTISRRTIQRRIRELLESPAGGIFEKISTRQKSSHLSIR